MNRALAPLLALVVAFSGVALPAWSASAREPYKSDADLIAAVMPAFVDIYNRGVVPGAKGANGAPDEAPVIQDEVGSGFIVDPSGLIVTNRHVIEGAYSLFVTLADGAHVPAKLVSKGLTFDIALIKIDVGHPLPVATLGDSDKLRIGDRVIAIGNPLGFANSASAGIVSAFHRKIGLSSYDDLIQTDATINQGNSGGPLFNMDGEVVGINQAIYTQNKGGSIGIGFSIPVNQAKFLMDNIGKYGKPHIGALGVLAQTVTPGMAASLGIPEGGVILSQVNAGGSASDAGLKVGDVIAQFGDYKTTDTSVLNKAVVVSVDQTVKARIFRDGKPMAISVAVKPSPATLWATQLADPPNIRSLEDLGMKVADRPEHDGVAVEDVAQKSIAWSAGVRAGDIVRKVQGRKVHSIKEAEQTALELRGQGKDSAVVLLDGPNGARWVELSIRE